MRNRIRFSIALAIVCGYLAAFAPVPAAQAGMIGTEALLDRQARAERVENVRQMLAEDRVAEQMVALGVAPAEAQERVAGLTDAELVRMEGKLESLPAGGDTLSTLGIVFAVLLVLELFDVINLFEF